MPSNFRSFGGHQCVVCRGRMYGPYCQDSFCINAAPYHKKNQEKAKVWREAQTQHERAMKTMTDRYFVSVRQASGGYIVSDFGKYKTGDEHVAATTEDVGRIMLKLFERENNLRAKEAEEAGTKR